MSPRKKYAAKKSSKHFRYDDNLFRNRDAYNAYIEFYSEAMIIVEREVNLESLSATFISEVFRDRTWTPLLTGSTKVCDPLVQKFFLNAFEEEDHLNCWVLGKQFLVSLFSIQNLLQIYQTSLEYSLPYDERRTPITNAME